MTHAARGIVAAALALAAACGIVSASFIANNYLLQVGTTLALQATLCFSWNLVGGFMGYPSFATAALLGTGIYAGAILQAVGWSLALAWPAAALAGGLVAGLLGLVLLNLRGHYFAIGTIAIVQVLHEVANNWDGLTGGAIGMNLPMATGSPDEVSRFFYLAMWSVTSVALLVTVLVARSRFGFALRCIRQNEQAAAMVGVDVYRTKLAAFVLSGLLAGMAGAIYASLVSYVQPDDAFNLITSIEVPVMVLLGGAGTILGPLVGATLYIVLNEFVWTHFINFHNAILGIIVVLVIYFLPRGVLGAGMRFVRYLYPLRSLGLGPQR